MQRKLQRWFAEFFVLLIYKLVIEFGIIRGYIETYDYMFEPGKGYVFSSTKFIIGFVAFVYCTILLYDTHVFKRMIYHVLLRFLYCICVIPMISVYSFYGSVTVDALIFPLLFYTVLILSLKKYAHKKSNDRKVNIVIPEIKRVDNKVLLFCGVFTVAIWALAGFPVALNLDSAYERRMALRLTNISPLLNYPYMIIGGSVLPFIFAKYYSKRKYWYAAGTFACGILLFFINGMKTWIMIYVVAAGIAVLWKSNALKDGWKQCLVIDVLFLWVAAVCVALYDLTGKYGLLAEFSRVVLIPNSIGFTSVDFFRKNELLYLRESVLRAFLKSPYPGGSDFYMYHGADVTATTGRANNGLWGDAFRNFGIVGMLIYPFLISKVFNLVEKSSRGFSLSFRVFVLFLILWAAVNTSFFTWLLTDGVIVILLLIKLDASKKRYLTESGDL